MKKLTNALALRTDFFEALFDGTSPGPSQVWSLEGTSGSFVYNDLNGISEEGDPIISSSDGMYFYYNGIELYGSDFTWVGYGLEVHAINLYGKHWTGLSTDTVTCVKTVSSGSHDLGNDRVLDRIENLFFPTLDGHGFHRETTLTILKNTENAANIDSVVYGNLFGVANPLLERMVVDYSYIGRLSCGFDYETLAAMQADWTADAGITMALARTGGVVYPNLLPNYDSTDWVVSGTPTKNSATSYTLGPGDSIRCWTKMALPVNRLGGLSINITANAGSLTARLGFNSKLNNIDFTDTASYVGTGTQILTAMTSGVSRAIFVELVNEGAGNVTVENPCVQMRRDPSYTAHDGSVLSNNGWWNACRISGNTLSGKKIRRTFGSPIDVSKTTALGMWLLPMNENDPVPAFRYYVKDELGVTHTMSELSIWIDYNERYLNQTGKFNYWDDGFYWEFIPDGVTQVTEVGIEFLTDVAIDWIIDDYFFFTDVKEQRGPGAYKDFRMGLTPPNTRIDDRCLSNYITGKVVGDPTRVRDKVQIIVVDQGGGSWYAEKSNTSAPQNMVAVTPNPDVYQFIDATHSTTWASVTDEGDIGYLTMPADCEIIGDVNNVTKSEKYRVLEFDTATKILTLDVTGASAVSTDAIDCAYQKKETAINGVDYLFNYDAGKGVWIVEWLDTAWVQARDRDNFYVEYDVQYRNDSKTAVSLIGDRQVRHIATDMRQLETASPKVVNFNRLFFSQEGNTKADCLTTYYFHTDKTDAQISAAAEAQYLQANLIDTNSRIDPFNPLPVNYNIVPHISFGGEFVAEDPMETVEEVGERLAEGNIGNIIMGGGSLAAIKSRVRDYWFAWGSAVMDNGISYGDAMRQVIRRGYENEEIAARPCAHRYFVEVTLFNYKWLTKHRDQIALGPDGSERFKRVWYYETAAGDDFYVVQHTYDDFDPSYYNDQSANGKTYQFVYHYIMNYPALWSCITPGSQWGGITTIFDLWMRVAEAYAREYDCEGVIFSEYIMSYKYGCSSRDLQLYNAYRTANSLPTLGDWVRTAGGDVQCDNEELWDWKVWQTNQAMDTAATMLHSYGKLLGASTEVEPIISVFDETSPVWTGVEMLSRDYAFGTDPVQTHWHIRDLSRNCRRYGQDYSELFVDGRLDFGYVWLYHRYAPAQWWDTSDQNYDPAKDIITDFIQQYSQYKERLLVGIGLYPRRDPPPTSQEVKDIIGRLVDAGFNVAYPGWPRIITVDTYQDMWDWFKDRVPEITAIQTTGNQYTYNIDPKLYKGLAFLVRDSS